MIAARSRHQARRWRRDDFKTVRVPVNRAQLRDAIAVRIVEAGRYAV